MVVEPLGGNGGGLTGASIARLRCTYHAGGPAGPASMILKLSDSDTMHESKKETGCERHSALDGSCALGVCVRVSRVAATEPMEHTQWRTPADTCYPAVQ